MIFRFKNKSILLTAGLIIALLNSCNGQVRHYTRPDTDTGRIRSIAVLPLDNLTNDANAHEKIRSIVNMDLLARGFDVTEPGEVIISLQEMKITSVKKITGPDIQGLGSTLKVDAVMTGTVSAFETVKGMSVSYPEVTVTLSLYEVQNGTVIWSAWHTAGGPGFMTRHFGSESATLAEASKQVVREAIDTLF